MNNPVSPNSAPTPPINILAKVSLVCGIISGILMAVINLIDKDYEIQGILFFSVIMTIWAGHAATTRIRESRGTQTGAGLAVAGLIIGYVNLVIFVVAFCRPLPP